VINSVDDSLMMSLVVTCDQRRSAIGSFIHVVLLESNGWPH